MADLAADVRNADAVAELVWEARSPFLATEDVPVDLSDPRVRAVQIPVEAWRKVMAALAAAPEAAGG